ncbi:MAG: F0F1 ATP synthase subunit B [Lachnospiraceae bacterium]|nr:F0F1 ATP synthase subunit B [Lachnospiraceae bacterium]
MDQRMFGLDLQLLFDSGLTLLAVFVLFLVLSYNLFIPARKFLKNRRDRIENELAEAASDKDEALRLKEEYETKLREVDKEVEQILADARKKAQLNAKKIEEAAKKDAAAIVERANKEAELEKQRVSDEVKQEMVSIASLMAQKVVAGKIDTAVQDSLVEETLKEIGEDTWLS